MRVLEVSDAGMEKYYELEQKPLCQMDDEERAFIASVDYITQFVTSHIYSLVNSIPRLNSNLAREWLQEEYFEYTSL